MNLFPEDDVIYVEEEAIDNEIKFKPSYAFDFNTGEFKINPDGTIPLCNELEAFAQWCNKAMLTPRYKLGYSWVYGHELKALIGSSMCKKAIELEIKRMTIETLKVHPKTKDVDNFTFNWSGNGKEVSYTYEITTIYDENFLLKSEMKK